MEPQTFQNLIQKEGKKLLGDNLDFTATSIDGIVHSHGTKSILYSARYFSKDNKVYFARYENPKEVPVLLEVDYQTQKLREKEDELNREPEPIEEGS